MKSPATTKPYQRFQSCSLTLSHGHQGGGPAGQAPGLGCQSHPQVSTGGKKTLETFQPLGADSLPLRTYITEFQNQEEFFHSTLHHAERKLEVPAPAGPDRPGCLAPTW